VEKKRRKILEKALAEAVGDIENLLKVGGDSGLMLGDTGFSVESTWLPDVNKHHVAVRDVKKGDDWVASIVFNGRQTMTVEEVKNVLRSLGLHACMLRVLYSGAFSVAYDFNQVLLAAKMLENVDDVEFVLQGGGELSGYVKSRVEELRLNNVKVVDRIVSRAEVAKLLGESDVLILPLRDFGTPFLGISSKLYEYQAAGKPIICCGEGQPAEYVKETGSGVVVKPGDYEASAKAVLYLKENKDTAGKLGASGARYVKNNLSIEKIGLIMKNLLGALTQRASVRGM